MGLYALGKTAAINSILAAVDARISTQSDGSKSLDRASLSQWLGEQGALVVSADVAAGNVEAARGVLAVINANPDSERLSNTIDRRNWMGRSDWPTAHSITSGQGFISMVAGAMQDMDRAVSDIEAIYTGHRAGIETVLNAAALELALDAKLPQTKDLIIDDRFYIYTYVDSWDQESAPSPVSAMVTCDQDDTVGIVIGAAPSGRNINRWRFYRSNTGSSGSAFQFLAEGAIGVLTGTDNKPASQLGEVCPTTTWAEPPLTLAGLVGMSNGIWAGFFDNTVCFSEAFVNYAWPTDYQVTTALPINAIGSLGEILLVSHHGGIDYISGSDPASMSSRPNVSLQACVAARSMVQIESGTGAGLMYASADGLCLATASGVQLITENLVTREDWQTILPTSSIGAYHEKTYYMLWNNGTIAGCYALHLDSGKLTTLDVTGSAFYTDVLSDRLYAAQGLNIVAVFGGTAARTGTWRSKIFVLPKQAGFAWLTIESTFTSPITVNWYAEGVLRHTVAVSSRTPVRLPAGQYLEHEIEVVSQARWSSLSIASSTAELQKV